MMDKEKKIQELRNKISYLTEQLKTTHDQVERGLISDKILDAKRELGVLNSVALDRVRKVDIIDAPPIADRLEAEKGHIKSSMSFERNKITIQI